MTAHSVLSQPTAATAAECWQVETLGRQPGLTRVSRAGDDVQVRVGDQVNRPDRLADADGGPVPALRSLLSARLSPAGVAHVTARCAPPAMLLTGNEVRLVPGDGSTYGAAPMRPGDLLVLRSAALLDAEPQVLVDLLTDAESARRLPLSELARRLLAGSVTGAVAVVRFTV